VPVSTSVTLSPKIYVDSSVGIVTCSVLDSQCLMPSAKGCGGRMFCVLPFFQTDFGTHRPSCKMGMATASHFSLALRHRSVKLVSILHLLLRLRIRGNIPPLPHTCLST
jgi:hypothetical protein